MASAGAAGAVLLCARGAAAEEQGLRRAGRSASSASAREASASSSSPCARSAAGAPPQGAASSGSSTSSARPASASSLRSSRGRAAEYASEERAEREHDDNLIGPIVVAGLPGVRRGVRLGAVLCYHACAPVEAPLVQKRPAGDRRPSRRASAGARGRPSRRKRGSGLGPDWPARGPRPCPDSAVAAVGK